MRRFIVRRRKAVGILLVVMFMVLLVFFFIIIYIMYIFSYHTPILIDPCDDFYKFSCSWWFAGIPGYGILTGRHLALITNRTRIILEDKSMQVDDAYSENLAKAKLMYSTCIENMGVRQSDVGYRYLNHLISHLQPWPITEPITFGPQRVYTSVDLRRILGLIYRLGFSDGIFDLSTVRSHQFPYLTRLKIQQKQESLFERFLRHPKRYYDKLKTFIFNFMEHLGRYSAKAIATDVENMIHLKQEIDNLVDSTIQYKNNINEMTVDTLSINSDIDWRYIFHVMFSPNQLFDDVIIIQNKEFIFSIGNLMHNNIRAAINLIVWQTLQQFIWHTNPKFANVEEKLNPIPYRLYYRWQEHSSVMAETYSTKKITKKWEKCVNTVIQCFPNTLLRVYSSKYGSKRNQKDIAEFVSHNINSFLRQLEIFDWMDKAMKDNITEKFLEMQTLIGFDPSYDDVILSESDIVIDEIHLQNVVKCQRLNQRLMTLSLFKNSIFNTFDYLLNAEMYYDHLSNVLNIMTSLTLPPYYSANDKSAVTFGLLGSIINQVFILALKNEFIKHDFNGNYNKLVECFIQKYNKFLPLNNSFEVSTIQYYIAVEGGIRLAFRAYKQWLADHKHEAYGLTKLAFTEFTSDQLFFLSYAMMYCTTIDNDLINYMKEYASKIEPWELVNESLMNMFELKLAFNCSDKHKMMKEKSKCKLL